MSNNLINEYYTLVALFTKLRSIQPQLWFLIEYKIILHWDSYRRSKSKMTHELLLLIIMLRFLLSFTIFQKM